jgi:Regulator of chromosome condensation (RCC1) repeat
VAGVNATGNAGVTVNLDSYPVITALTANPAQIVPGETTTLSVMATDPDGDALTYAWSTPCPGTFSAPDSATTSFTLSASATDGCGLNTSGQASPPAGNNFVSVSAGSGSNDTCAVKSNGTIACWGQNTYGQTSPPSGSLDVVSVAQNHTCALSAGGILRCWGYYWNAP